MSAGEIIKEANSKRKIGGRISVWVICACLFMSALPTFVHQPSKSSDLVFCLTAVCLYLIRDSDMKDGFYRPNKSFPRKPRRLDNSRVYDFSWSCVLIFVDEWQDEGSLIHQEADNLIPKSIYMPDGRIVPICIVEAPKAVSSEDEDIDINNLAFPVNKVGGGFSIWRHSGKQPGV